ncbi:MAG: enoyl-CoA hydratase-related protein [Sporichthyaceae bacterium]
MSDTVTEVEVALALYPALATGDRGSLDALLDPACVGETTAGLPLSLGGRYESAAAMRKQFWGVIAKHYEVVAEPESAHALGDGRVLVTGTYRGSARASGRKFEAAFTHTVTVCGGRIAAIIQLTDSAAWAAALEVAPGAPAPDAPPRPPITTLRLDLDGDVGEIRLQRPHANNAVDLPQAQDLLTAAQACAADERIRVLLLTAEGRTFSTGGDLAMLSGTPQDQLPALLDHMLTDYHLALQNLISLDVPIVAAVHGSAGGGSMGLLYVSDVVIAGTDAKFAVGSGALALGSDGGNTFFLPQLVGRRLAAQMCYQNRVLDASEALAHGLVSEVVPTEVVAERAAEVARGLAANSRRSNAKLRDLLRLGADRTVCAALDSERNGMVTLATSPDVAEGMRAFLERRPAQFRD